MRDNYILTAESITEGHPDKLCDYIADSVLDACLEHDPDARVACEVLATAGKIIVAGEISTVRMPDIPHIVSKAVRETGYCSDYEIEVCVHEQSPDIAEAVDGGQTLGAGDQGIIYGYACNDTDELLPMPVVLAHRITRLLTNARRTGQIPELMPDGKAQVSVEYEHGVPKRVAAVVVTTQHSEDAEKSILCAEIRRKILGPAFRDFPMDMDTKVLINPGGDFILGGFEADTGLTGRKLMVDTYGGLVPHGGGALSGKDGTKVDRSAAYMARHIAKNIVASDLADECTVGLAYAIGEPEPVAVTVHTHGTGLYPDEVLEEAVKMIFDLTPEGMIHAMHLKSPRFAKWCNYGHFTHGDAPWEQTGSGTALEMACAMIEAEV